jgi:hypothetical protein
VTGTGFAAEDGATASVVSSNRLLLLVVVVSGGKHWKLRRMWEKWLRER